MMGPWTSEWMSSRSLVEWWEEEEGKGSATIFPARQGSQMGSGLEEEVMLRPVTRFSLIIVLRTG